MHQSSGNDHKHGNAIPSGVIRLPEPLELVSQLEDTQQSDGREDVPCKIKRLVGVAKSSLFVLEHPPHLEGKVVVV